MKKRKIRALPVVALLAVLALVAAACGDDSAESTTTAATTTTAAGTTAATTTSAGSTAAALPCRTDTDNVLAGELAYYTGEFAPYGKMLTGSLTFPIDEVINADPPLGRHWDFVAEDIGTTGEAAAAHKLIEENGVDILISPAHGYGPYRSWFIEWEAEHDSPLGPTVHGGSIPFDIGGDVAEPIFRAQGPDAGLCAEATIYAGMIGAQTVVIFATQVEGFQLAATAAEDAVPVVGGIELLARIDAPATQDSYRTQAQQIADLNPDAVIMEAGSLESATLIKEAAEAGLSTNWIGEPGWSQAEFLETLGLATIDTQLSVGYVSSGFRNDNAAWDSYSATFTGSSYGADPDFLGPENVYNYTAYDLLVLTALAVEYGGSYCASDWAPAMFEVAAAPGTVCYTYADCLAAVRAGEDIDYEGVTGPGDFVPGGMNTITPVVILDKSDGTTETVYLEPVSTLEIVNEVSVPGGDSWAG
ncbi:MAG: ABC transporter substrate-binding protein [Actinomycetota bacterium]